MGRANQQLEESEQLIAEFGKRNNIELEEQLRMTKQAEEQDIDSSAMASAGANAVNKESIKWLRWKEGEKAPCGIGRYYDAVKHNDTVYLVS